jgi:hypothetical protein
MRSDNRANFTAALVGGLVVALLLAVLPASAGDGDGMILGTKNHARRVTKLIGKNGLEIRASKNIPMRLFSPDGVPPLQVNQQVLVDNLNADLVDGLDAEAFASAGHGHDPTTIVVGAPELHGVGGTENAWLGDEWVNLGGYVALGRSDDSEFLNARLFAPLDLPDGATVDSLSARVYDLSAQGSVEVRLLRGHRVDSPAEAVDWVGCWTLLQVESSSAADPGWTTVVDSTVAPETCPEMPAEDLAVFDVVDNDQWYYYLQVEMVATAADVERFRSAVVTVTPEA